MDHEKSELHDMGLKDWLRMGTAPPEQAVQRWVVLDVETSGLDVTTAELLAVACIGLEVNFSKKTLTINPGDSFEIVIQPSKPVEDVSNILIHGIGMQRQQMGLPAWQALPLLRDYLKDSPLLAFHAWFDQALLSRHCAATLGHELSNPWLDIEKLCSVTQPDAKAEDLDQWLDHFDIPCSARHEAAADAFAEAEILQRIWPQLMKELGDSPSWHGLKKFEKLNQWLSR